MDEREKLEMRFHQRMLDILAQAKSECGYHATRFKNMVLNRGGLEAAKLLLSTDAYSEGLTRLWEEKRLDITMEATVLKEPWRQLFTEAELQTARNKLKALGYEG